MRVRANTVAFPETLKAGKALPEVLESRQELINAVKKTEIYGSKRGFSSKNPLSDQLHKLVSLAENRSQLYGKDLDATAANLIEHMALLESIGNTLNPTTGMYTARGEQTLKSEPSKNTPPSINPEDRAILIKFLTSEANLCSREIDRIEPAFNAREKSFSNYASYKAGIAGIANQVKTFDGNKPEVYLKVEYHRVQQETYARAADDYHRSARLFSEAQLYDSAIKGQEKHQDTQTELIQRTDLAINDERNTRITKLTEDNTQNTRKDVRAEVSIIMEKLDTQEEREIAKKGSGLSGTSFREVNAITKREVKEAKTMEEASDAKIANYEKTQKESRKETASNLREVDHQREKIMESATKFVGEKDTTAIKYKTLVTKSRYQEDCADKAMAKAAKEIENGYEDKGYNLNTNKEMLKAEDTSIRTSLLEFKKLKATVTEFQDNLSSFVSSVEPMKTTRERSTSISITKKPPTDAAAAPSPHVAALLRAREANRQANNPKVEPEKEKGQVTVPKVSGPK